MRRGDRSEAMRIINHVLVHIYSAGEERSDLLKGLLLELVVMISRAAIEAGAVQSAVLGTNFRILTGHNSRRSRMTNSSPPGCGAPLTTCSQPSSSRWETHASAVGGQGTQLHAGESAPGHHP